MLSLVEQDDTRSEGLADCYAGSHCYGQQYLHFLCLMVAKLVVVAMVDKNDFWD